MDYANGGKGYSAAMYPVFSKNNKVTISKHCTVLGVRLGLKKKSFVAIMVTCCIMVEKKYIRWMYCLCLLESCVCMIFLYADIAYSKETTYSTRASYQKTLGVREGRGGGWKCCSAALVTDIMFFCLGSQNIAHNFSGYSLMKMAALESGVSMFTEKNLNKVYKKTLQMLAAQKNSLRAFANYRGKYINVHKRCYKLQDEVFDCLRSVRRLLEISKDRSVMSQIFAAAEQASDTEGMCHSNI